MNEMTVDDFIEREIDRLNKFKFWRTDRQRRDPEAYPVYMDEFDWLDRYNSFVEGIE